jgi:hypothetical protein
MAFTVSAPAALEALERAGRELRKRAAADAHGCFGYFPALRHADGIHSDLPACRAFAATLPEMTLGGMSFSFNFIRASLVQQSSDPAYHLDSDAATAVTGDLSTLDDRLVRRALLNLSPDHPRTLHYLDVDSSSVELVTEGSYVRVARPEELGDFAVRAVIPPRRDTVLHGIDFYSNKVFHSGTDDEWGHFVAGYGYEVDLRPAASCPQFADAQGR